MLSSLSVKNFQKHKSKKINFTNGINVIIGTSNIGKTAILRALYWLIENKPRGLKTILTHNEKEVSVVLNDTITRRRSQRINEYQLVDKVFEAVSDKVPSEITNALPLTNIQKQHDPSYLIALEPASRAHFFNKLLKLDLMDKLQANIERKRRALLVEIKSLDVEPIKAKVEKLNWVDEAKSLLNKYNAIEQALQNIKLPQDIELYKKCLEKMRGKEILEKIMAIPTVKLPQDIERYEKIKETLVILKERLAKETPEVCPFCGNLMLK